MSLCLLPQFKSPTDLLHLITKSHHHSISMNLLTKWREPVLMQCMMSTPSVTLLDIEDCSNAAVTGLRPWTYFGNISPATEDCSVPTLPPKEYVTSVEAVIPAAAEEAKALAKAAAEVAKAAALMTGKYNSINFLSNSNTIQLKTPHLIKTEQSTPLEHSIPTEIRSNDSDEAAAETEPSREEIQRLQDEFSLSVAVRSNGRGLKTNRKAKVDVAERFTGSGYITGRKRTSLPEVVYSDPLRYLRGTTGTFKLLTAKEEMTLSAGIQVLTNLENSIKYLNL